MVDGGDGSVMGGSVVGRQGWVDGGGGSARVTGGGSVVGRQGWVDGGSVLVRERVCVLGTFLVLGMSRVS